jgi:hypothetical protein
VRSLVLVTLALGAVLAGCASRQRPPTSDGLWAATLASAESAAMAGRYAAADSVLADYNATHPAAHDTVEVLFWRAMYLLDPVNTRAEAPAEALAIATRYLSAGDTLPRRYEAEVLRRLAAIRATPVPVRVDTVRSVDTVAVRSAVTREMELRAKAYEEELAQLRDSLARTTAELERIRRRLAPQRP